MNITTQAKEYKPTKKTMNTLKTGERVLKDKNIDNVIKNLSPVAEGDPYTTNPLWNLWKLALPFTKEQVSRMSEETKKEILECTITGLGEVLKQKIEVFLGEHVILEETSYEKKLKYLVTFGEEPEILSHFEYEKLVGYFIEMLKSSTQHIFVKQNYVVIGPEHEKWIVVEIQQEGCDKILSKFHTNCLKLFSHFSYYILEAAEVFWLKMLREGLGDKEKEMYKSFKLKPFTYMMEACLEKVKYEGKILCLEQATDVLHYYEVIKEIETENTIGMVEEFVVALYQNIISYSNSPVFNPDKYTTFMKLCQEKFNINIKGIV